MATITISTHSGAEKTIVGSQRALMLREQVYKLFLEVKEKMPYATHFEVCREVGKKVHLTEVRVRDIMVNDYELKPWKNGNS